MKKTITILSLFLFIVSNGQLRKTKSTIPEFSLKAGFNYSLVDNFQSVVLKPNVGFNLSFAYFANLNDIFVFPFEVEYKKASVSSYSKEYDLSTVGINTLVAVYFNKSMFVELGPSFAYVLSPSTDVGRRSVIPNVVNPISEPFNTNTFDMSFAMGAGYVINKDISISIRYNYGFSKTFKYNNSFYYIDSDATSFIGIRGGYNF